MDYQYSVLVDICMGEVAWYTISVDCVLRAKPTLKSEQLGFISKGIEVRVDKVHEIAGGNLRAHICETRGEGAENCPTDGWATATTLSCHSKMCGCCHDCGMRDLLPSHNYHRLTK